MKAENYPYAPRPFAPQIIEGGYRSHRSEVVRLLACVATPAGLIGVVLGFLLGRWL
jgi:hypothetical protein